MPLYEYEVVLPDGTAGEVFEVLQPMSDPPLTEHPESGEPVRRVFGMPNTPRTWTASHAEERHERQEPRADGIDQVREERPRQVSEAARARVPPRSVVRRNNKTRAIWSLAPNTLRSETSRRGYDFVAFP